MAIGWLIHPRKPAGMRFMYGNLVPERRAAPDSNRLFPEMGASGPCGERMERNCSLSPAIKQPLCPSLWIRAGVFRLARLRLCFDFLPTDCGGPPPGPYL